jgi:endonuclease-3 related protein
MYERFGPQKWWPADTPFEVIVGAILTQNTNWKNVQKAILGLKKDDLMYPEKLSLLGMEDLATRIRPAGYFRVKAERLLAFIDFFRGSYGFDIDRLRGESTSTLREKLLEVKGIGQETADSILLYALEKPIFVVDAYTRRVLSRHNLIGEKAKYQQIQHLFMSNLPEDVSLFNEYHALLVRVGKEHCRKQSQCDKCPLEPFLDN